VWKKEKRQGKPTKVPYNPRNGRLAKTNEPETFTDFNTAMKTFAMGGYDGIGYRVSEGIGAIDIDHCIREDGSLNDVAASILGFFPDAYFERSPSGTGLRGFFRLSPDFAYDKTIYYINNRKHGLEVYLPGVTNRFVTVTGDVYRQGSVTRNDEALQATLDTFMKRANPVSGPAVEPSSYLDDESVVEHATHSEQGDKFKMLMEGRWEEGYDSQSDADMALVTILAFWCGNVAEQIDRIFRSSGLMRPKWDRKTGDSTYGQITIRNAISSNETIYLPIAETSSAEDDFEDALFYVFGEKGSEKREKYKNLITKIEDYHYNVMKEIDTVFESLREDEVKVGVIAKYGFQLAPITESRDYVADQFATVEKASFGATTSTVYEPLLADYIAVREAEGKGKYISPDKRIDASTCAFPDSTWFTKGITHSNWTEFETSVLLAVVTADRQLTVDDFEYTQFVVYDNETETAYPMTEDNYKTEAWEANKNLDKPADKHGVIFSAVYSLIKWVMEVFRFIMSKIG